MPNVTSYTGFFGLFLQMLSFSIESQQIDDWGISIFWTGLLADLELRPPVNG